MRKACFVFIIVLVSLTAFSDTISYYSIYYNDSLVESNNVNTEIKNVEIDINTISAKDSLFVFYYYDSPCVSCNHMLLVHDSNEELRLKKSSKTPHKKLSISVKDLYDIYKKSGDYLQLYYNIIYSDREKTQPQALLNISFKSFVKMKLKFRIIPEDFEKAHYAVDWEDTLGQSLGYFKDKNQHFRPLELWCYITNLKGDTLGYYKGLSTAMTFSYFTSKNDSIVKLNFLIGPNYFENKDEAKNFLARQNRIIKFKPIEVNLKNELYDFKEVILISE